VSRMKKDLRVDRKIDPPVSSPGETKGRSGKESTERCGLLLAQKEPGSLGY